MISLMAQSFFFPRQCPYIGPIELRVFILAQVMLKCVIKIKMHKLLYLYLLRKTFIEILL